MYKKLAILDLFCEIFNLPNFISNMNASSVAEQISQGTKDENLLSNYVALLLLAFQKSGAFDALTILSTESEEGSQINRQSKELLRKIIFLSSYLLPDVPQFSKLINIATDFTEGK
jgi:hypothetical protein